MSKKRKHSSYSLKEKLELLKRIDEGESATKLALEFFLHPVRINWKFGIARLHCTCSAQCKTDRVPFLGNLTIVLLTRDYENVDKYYFRQRQKLVRIFKSSYSMWRLQDSNNEYMNVLVLMSRPWPVNSKKIPYDLYWYLCYTVVYTVV
jgi:hypothetical protein